MYQSASIMLTLPYPSLAKSLFGEKCNDFKCPIV